MTLKIQLSDKRGDAILLVAVESDDNHAPAAEEVFANAVGLVGLGTAYESFGAAAPATIPSITQLTRPQVPAAAAESWGNPPVPPMQQYQQAPQYAAAAPAAPAGAPGPAPVCQHGQKLYKTGISAKTQRPWQAWFCPAPGNDPTQCEKEWIR